MIVHQNQDPAALGTPEVSAEPLQSKLSFCRAWVATCADYYAAAAMYEQLSRLSNAELERRGLNRASLARVVCDNCDRTNTR